MNLNPRLRAHVASRVRSTLRSGSAFLFGGLMLGNLLAYVYQMFMARILSPADYGILITLTSVSYVLSVIMRTIQAWVIEAVTSRQGATEGHVRAVFLAVMNPILLLGGIAFAAQWLSSGWVARFLHLGSTTAVIVLGLYTVSSFLVPVSRGLLLGVGRLHTTSVLYVLEPIARTVVGVTLVIWGFGVNGAIGSYAAGNMAAFVVGLILLGPVLYRHGSAVALTERPSALDRYALLALLINTYLVVISSVDQIAVKHFFSADIAGNYAVAFLLGRVIAFSAISLGWVIFARSASLPPDDPIRAQLLLKGLLLIGTFAVTLTLGYLVSPALPVRLLSGSRYVSAGSYVGLVGVETTLFSLVYLQAYYQISVRKMQVAWPLGFATALEILLLARYHGTVQQVLLTLIAVLSGLLLWVSILSWRMLRGSGRPSNSTDPRPEDPSGVAVVA